MISCLFVSCPRKETLRRRDTLYTQASVFSADKWVDHSPVLPTHTAFIRRHNQLKERHGCVALMSLTFCPMESFVSLSWGRGVF